MRYTIYSVVFAAAVVVAVICAIIPYADAAPTVSVGSSSAVPGSTVNLPITLSGNTSIVGCQFDMVFNVHMIKVNDSSPAKLGSALYNKAFNVVSTGKPDRIRVVIVPPVQNPIPVIPNGEII